jgi:hypothetical protein
MCSSMCTVCVVMYRSSSSTLCWWTARCCCARRTGRRQGRRRRPPSRMPTTATAATHGAPNCTPRLARTSARRYMASSSPTESVRGSHASSSKSILPPRHGSHTAEHASRHTYRSRQVQRTPTHPAGCSAPFSLRDGAAALHVLQIPRATAARLGRLRARAPRGSALRRAA